ncbi:MAG: outer membrane beta-barrel protein, partial [Steroidobacteraceae bacterium]
MRKWIYGAAFLALLASTARASEGGSWYGGAGLGSANPDYGDSRSAWTAFAGYRVSRFAALEAGYWDLGEMSYDGIMGYLQGYDRGLRQAYARINGRLPLAAGFALIAGAGVARSDHRLENVRPGTGPRPPGAILPAVILSPREYPGETNFTWAAGVEWDAAAHFGLRATWSEHSTDGLGLGSDGLR